MRVLHVAAECAPLVKVGGLADVVGALPKSQRRMGIDASAIMPAYSQLAGDRSVVWEGEIGYGSRRYAIRVCLLGEEVIGFPVYLVDETGHFGRPGIYQDAETGLDFENQGDRFAVFQLGVLHFLASAAFPVDVLHLHDHHTGLLPYLLRREGRPAAGRPRIVYTVHSAEHQGCYPIGDWRKWDPAGSPPGDILFRGEINSMKAGITVADAVTTVSPSYAEELLRDDAYSAGLRPVFASASHKLHGILNGIDVEVWHPSRDHLLPATYSASDMVGKAYNKQRLCAEFDLDARVPLFTFVGRLVDEKGMGILPDALEAFMTGGARANVFVLGTGYPQYEELLLAMVRNQQNRSELNGRMVVRLEFNNELAHRLYAASDFLLMPSRVEPCGLNQLYALTYGTIPIVHAVGGLKDTVDEFDAESETGNGFTFGEFSVSSFLSALKRAYEVFDDEGVMHALRVRAMQADWSWAKSASRYDDLYRSVLQET